MMDIQEIKKIIALFEKSEISEMELELNGSKIRLKKELTAPVVFDKSTAKPITPLTILGSTEPEVEDENGWVKAPLVGTLYASPSPTSAPFVSVGQKVNEGDVVCVIEAMKVMNEIKAHRGGIITKVNADNGIMVEYNQKLICIGDADAA
jgi:acetyl-CoA carboxylase biotin carboxyl carrier protein